MFVLGNETRQEGQQPENPGGEMRCNEGLVPTERKEKKQDVHAAELASAFDIGSVENWTVDRRPRIFLGQWTWRVSQSSDSMIRS